MPLEDKPIADIEAYFDSKGLTLKVHSSPPDTPSKEQARRSHWADLGPAPHYGSGDTHDDAIRRAARRYRIAQAPDDLDP
jgi:hypothetical protein